MAEPILHLLPTADAPRRARALVSSRLRGVLGEVALGDAILLVNELVVARLIMDGPDRDRDISVGLSIQGDRVVCRVTDSWTDADEGGWWPRDGHEKARPRLLDMLTEVWGVDPPPPLSGWFAIRRPALEPAR